MERQRAHDLHVVGALAQRTLDRFAPNGERLRQQVVQRLPIVEARAELVRLGAQRLVGQRPDFVAQGVDRVDGRPHPLEDALIRIAANDLLEEPDHAVALYSDEPHASTGARAGWGIQCTAWPGRRR